MNLNPRMLGLAATCAIALAVTPALAQSANGQQNFQPGYAHGPIISNHAGTHDRWPVYGNQYRSWGGTNRYGYNNNYNNNEQFESGTNQPLSPNQNSTQNG